MKNLKKQIKDRLEKIKNETLGIESLAIRPCMSKHKKELMLMNLGSEETTLNWVLLLIDQESGSTDGMRSKEEIKSEMTRINKKCDQYKNDLGSTDSVLNNFKLLSNLSALQWVLNEQEGKQ